MSPWREEHADRKLIQQLMLRGWYRLGQGPHDESGQLIWGFREGHLLETPRAHTVWISAADEITAMRRLLTMLREDAQGRSKRRVPARHDIGPHDLWPDYESMNATPERQRV